jgi:hydroxymethylbilane synthase
MIEIVKITTTGDKITDRSLRDIGGKSLFTKEIDQALLDKRIDIAVHSLKDITAKIDESLAIGAVLERKYSEDVFISYNYDSPAQLPKGAKIGTCSSRRKALINLLWPSLEVIDLRGNIQTRLEKLKNADFDATILSLAGLKRLNIEDRFCHVIKEKNFLPAVGQGAITALHRRNDSAIEALLTKINHAPSYLEVLAERGYLEFLNADCNTPIAARAKLDDLGKITLDTMYTNVKNNLIYFHTISGDSSNSYEIGVGAAKYHLSLA